MASVPPDEAGMIATAWVRKAFAFEQAVRELSRRYPPCKVPKYYPTSTTSRATYTVHEEDVHQRMIHDAAHGRYELVQRAAYRSGIPQEEINAVITLIYG